MILLNRLLPAASRGLLTSRSGLSLLRRSFFATPPSPSSSAFGEHDLSSRLAHLDLKYFRNNLEEVEKNLQSRKVAADLKGFAEVFDQQRAANQEILKLRQRRNEVSQELKTISTAKDLPAEEKKKKITQLSEEGKKLKERLSSLEEEHQSLSGRLLALADLFPNRTHPSVPLEHPQVVKEVGSKPQFGFTPRDHLALGKELEMLDFESAAEISGSSFYFLKGMGALLELGLVQYAFNFYMSKGFQPILPPDIVRTYVAASCGYRPRGEASQVYHLTGTDKCLVGTAEIPLAGMYQDKILTNKQLPLKMVAFGHAFRHEVGHRGQETRGLYRVHQFSKVEMFAITTPEESEAALEDLVAHQIQFFESLGLHFQVLNMPAHDLGNAASKKYDIEAWIPSRNEYGEISSASNCLDFQSRRLNIRHRVFATDSPTFSHTINGTGCAIPRIILALIENGQQADGSVRLPKALAPYLGGVTEIFPKIEK